MNARSNSRHHYLDHGEAQNAACDTAKRGLRQVGQLIATRLRQWAGDALHESVTAGRVGQQNPGNAWTPVREMLRKAIPDL
jgi:hypothetical protein